MRACRSRGPKGGVASGPIRSGEGEIPLALPPDQARRWVNFTWATSLQMGQHSTGVDKEALTHDVAYNLLLTERRKVLPRLVGADHLTRHDAVPGLNVEPAFLIGDHTRAQVPGGLILWNVERRVCALCVRLLHIEHRAAKRFTVG
jgi:hypothetical protein